VPALNLDEVDDGFLRFAWLNLLPRARSRVLAKSPKTFWLFGAGASCHYNLNAFGVRVPLANGFFEAFNNLPTSQGFHANVGPFVSFLEHYRGVPPLEVARWNENIEEFMTSIEEGLEALKIAASEREFTRAERERSISFSQVFNNMPFIFANVLNEAQNGPSMSLYRSILEVCGPNDTFATFNWDTLLDRALADTGGWTPNSGYGLDFRAVLDGSWKSSMDGTPLFSTNWKLLKLHGSTNWLVPYMAADFKSLEYKSIVPGSEEVFLYWHSALPYATHQNLWTGGHVPTTYCYYPPNIPGEFFAREQISAEPGHVFVRFTPRFLAAFEEGDPGGVPSSPILITPVRQKRYDTYRSTIQSLWKQAVKVLEDASRIVIVGYSIPHTDTRALDLIRSVLLARAGQIAIEIIAPDVTDIAARIGNDCLDKAKGVKLHNMRFEEYVDLLYESMPSLMRESLEDTEVREWLGRIYVSSRRRGAGNVGVRADHVSSEPE
jgi:hypothetical protein